MILCFSGTGNSAHAARAIAEVVGDEVVSLNERIKAGDESALHSDAPWLIVAPTYAWRMPRVVERHIRRTRLTGSDKAYFLLTCGESAGNAGAYARRLCAQKGFAYMGLAGIVMPENYVALFPVPDAAEAKAIVERAEPGIARAAALIQAGRPFAEQPVKGDDKLKSGPMNLAFYAFTVSAKGFHATAACVGCGRCAALCPLNNVELVDGKPRWGSRCTHCMGCICGCPALAVEYKQKSQGKPRYFLDEGFFGEV